MKAEGVLELGLDLRRTHPRGLAKTREDNLPVRVPCGKRRSQPDQGSTVLRRKLVHEGNSRGLGTKRFRR
jgi:hypothetical protein